MKAMRVDMAFFDGDNFLARALVLVHQEAGDLKIESKRGDAFYLTYQFEEPASTLYIKCHSAEGEVVSSSEVTMGVHNSDDWEKVELAEPYELCFKCAIVDCDNEDWATQEPIEED